MILQPASPISRWIFVSAGVLAALILIIDGMLSEDRVTPSVTAGPWQSLHVASTPITFTRDGRLEFRRGPSVVAFDALSQLAVPAALEASGSDAGTIRFRRRWQSSDQQASCIVEDALTVQEECLVWKVTITGVEGLWSAPLSRRSR